MEGSFEIGIGVEGLLTVEMLEVGHVLVEVDHVEIFEGGTVDLVVLLFGRSTESIIWEKCQSSLGQR